MLPARWMLGAIAIIAIAALVLSTIIEIAADKERQALADLLHQHELQTEQLKSQLNEIKAKAHVQSLYIRQMSDADVVRDLDNAGWLLPDNSKQSPRTAKDNADGVQ